MIRETHSSLNLTRFPFIFCTPSPLYSRRQSRNLVISNLVLLFILVRFASFLCFGICVSTPFIQVQMCVYVQNSCGTEKTKKNRIRNEKIAHSNPPYPLTTRITIHLCSLTTTYFQPLLPQTASFHIQITFRHLHVFSHLLSYGCFLSFFHAEVALRVCHELCATLLAYMPTPCHCLMQYTYRWKWRIRTHSLHNSALVPLRLYTASAGIMPVNVIPISVVTNFCIQTEAANTFSSFQSVVSPSTLCDHHHHPTNLTTLDIFSLEVAYSSRALVLYSHFGKATRYTLVNLCLNPAVQFNHVPTNQY